MTTIGHNNGPTMEPGRGWRRHAWARARRELLPRLPVEVIRNRVRRAKELGLEYRTYASVRAASGRDVVAFLFSSNALHVWRAEAPLSEERATRLRALENCGLRILVARPLSPGELAVRIAEQTGIRVEAAGLAPVFTDGWPEIRRRVLAALEPGALAAGSVVLVGDTGFEREWSEAARLGAYLPAERFFATPAR